VFHDPSWDFRSFDFDRDGAYADSKMEFLTANDPDLSRFQHRGGRLLIYQGCADPVVAPENTIRYDESVVRAAGEGQEPAMARLLLIPGMGHC
jgi:feruloyl esterase